MQIEVNKKYINRCGNEIEIVYHSPDKDGYMYLGVDTESHVTQWFNESGHRQDRPILDLVSEVPAVESGYALWAQHTDSKPLTLAMMQEAMEKIRNLDKVWIDKLACQYVSDSLVYGESFIKTVWDAEDEKEGMAGLSAILAQPRTVPVVGPLLYSDARAVWDGPRVAKQTECNHQWVDTGFKKTWCKFCDVEKPEGDIK
jgi:hypothetical protein